MKKIFKNRKVRYFAIIVGLFIYVIVSALSTQLYFDDIESAIKYSEGTNFKDEIITIFAEAAPVTIYLDKLGNLSILNYHTKDRNGKIMYRATPRQWTTGFLNEQFAVKYYNTFNRINQKPETEKVAYGIGREWGEKYSELTGIEATYVPFYYESKEYLLWYIIGKEEVEKVPKWKNNMTTVE